MPYKQVRYVVEMTDGKRIEVAKPDYTTTPDRAGGHSYIDKDNNHIFVPLKLYKRETPICVVKVVKIACYRNNKIVPCDPQLYSDFKKTFDITQYAVGEVTFSRNEGSLKEMTFTIPEEFPISSKDEGYMRFYTIDRVDLKAGSKEVTARIIAEKPGQRGIVPPNTIHVFHTPLLGVDAVTNKMGTFFIQGPENEKPK
jgi:hypothetical protein